MNTTIALHLKEVAIGRIQGTNESIRLDNLNYTYPETSNGIKRILHCRYVAINQLCLTVKGLVTDLSANILGAFLEAPSEQCIYANDIDLSTCSMDWWRTQVTAMSQKPHVMHGTLRDNIAFGQDVSDDELFRSNQTSGAT